MSPERSVRASDVALVVPVGGAAPHWARAAESLARLDPPPGELVVVVDGPDDRLEAIAETLVEVGARIVVLDRNGGPARARNRGAAVASRDVLFFVDADVELPRDSVARIAAILGADPGISAVMGSYDDAPADPAFLSQYRNLLHHFVHQQARKEASTFWAGCGAVRRAAFLEVGGFDETYESPSIEDIELGARLRRAGHRIRLARELQVKHLKRWGLVDLLRTDLWKRAVPWTELMLREGEMIDDLNVDLKSRIAVALAFAPLLCLPAAVRWPVLLLAALGAIVLLLVLHWPLLRFFRRQRGLPFALRVLPMYWIYLLICGVGFALGAARGLRPRAPSSPPEPGALPAPTASSDPSGPPAGDSGPRID